MLATPTPTNACHFHLPWELIELVVRAPAGVAINAKNAGFRLLAADKHV
jgi:hypothetical protein